MSVAIGASAAGARAYTATASQGLLYMAEALFNAVGARAADRDDGRQPRDRRADQHLERPLRRDGAARLRLDPAVRDRQPGGRRPARPGLPARRGALAAGDGVHGRLRAHPRLRAAGGPRRRSRSTRSCRRSRRARCSTPTTRSRSARWSGPRRSPRCATSRTPSRCRRSTLIPAARGGVRARASAAPPGGLLERLPQRGRGDRRASRLGSVYGTLAEVVDELRDRGHAIGALALKSLPPVPARGAARGAGARASAWSCSSARSPSASAGSSRADVRAALAGLPACETHTVIAGLGGRAITRRSLRALLDDALRGRPRRRCTSSTCGPTWSSASSRAPAAAGGRGRTPRASCATSASSPEGRYEHARAHALLPDGHLRGRRPPARPTASARCSPTPSAPTRSPRATAPARAAARRSARATRWTPRCAPPAGG